MIALLLVLAAGQDIPGTSPMDYNTLSRATTSSQIDNDVLGDVARNQRTRARPRARNVRSAAPADPALRARYCRESTPVYRRMNIPIDPACR